VKVKTADTFSRRFIGAMFKKPDYALALKPCNCIHTFFCRVPLDIYYIDNEGTVIRSVYNMRPWRFGPVERGASMVLEIPVPNNIKIRTGQKVFAKGAWMFDQENGEAVKV